MPDLPSKAQLDKLGDRLRAGSRVEADLRGLDEYRRSFREAYDVVTQALKEELGLEGTGRPAKTTSSIVDKLNRQRIRLTQIQDIAGLRLLVDGVLEQNDLVEQLKFVFSDVAIDDRRIKPSHGYRAVHMIVAIGERWVEIQIRTEEQHLWAEWSEKLSDVVDPTIKYGGGPENLKATLLDHSELIGGIEDSIRHAAESADWFKQLDAEGIDPQSDPELAEMYQEHLERQRGLRTLRKELSRLLKDQYNEVRKGQS